MNDSHYDFLKTLVETASPPGAEDEAARLWRNYVQPYATSLSGDSQGNSIALINPEGSPRVQLAGHLDEISLIVRYIDSDGFLYFDAAGGFDPLTIIGGRFHLLGPQGKILGVIGRKARHLQSDDEHRRSVEIDDLWLDIGAKDRAEAETAAPVGTYAVRAATFERLGTGSLVASRALDNKAGAYAIARALELLSKRAVTAAVYAVATVQEEVGLRGARVSAFGIDPAVAIAVDVTHASDYPTADKRRVGDIKVGGGPVVTFGPTVSSHVSALILRAADAAEIAVQREAVGRNTATDADAIQQVRAGIATGLVSIPLRYMHTGVEVASLDDIEKTAELLAAAVEHLGPRTSFVR
ncbi:MAG: M20/M25/M40 family metallo-hydrolase [Chloroflexi bacterium]|nr:M20/M25/M40 family metallo-hydrolase [Chloroflexota bacterium]